MNETSFRPQELGIPDVDWQQTPLSVRQAFQVLHQRLGKIEEQVQLNSGNSSKPPSSDGLSHKREKSKRLPSGKKRGGQPGHQGHHRKRLPAQEVNEFRVYKPENCAHCGEHLSGADPQPYRWQVTELPPIQAIVIEHQVHQLSCGCCGQTTGGELPAEVAKSQFGERLTALIGLLIGQYRLSKRQVSRILHDMYGIHLSVGSVVNRQVEIAESLSAPVEEVSQHVKQAGNRNIDETGWREGQARSYLWGVVTEQATLFHIIASRASEVASGLLGTTEPGITTSDRYSAYHFLRGERHQTCWAHLLRHFKRLTLRNAGSRLIGEMLILYTEYLLHRWRRVRDGTLSRADFLAQVPQHQHDIRWWLEQGAQLKHPKTATLCGGLLKHFEMLWTFTRHEGVEPTNNAVERALRHGVIWRKLCYGTDSQMGSRFAERILTVLATCRQQGQSLLDFLYHCLVALRHGHDSPALLTNPALISGPTTP